MGFTNTKKGSFYYGKIIGTFLKNILQKLTVNQMIPPHPFPYGHDALHARAEWLWNRDYPNA
jgi:hypothetical protein